MGQEDQTIADHPFIWFWKRQYCETVSVLSLVTVTLGAVTIPEHKTAANSDADAAVVPWPWYVVPFGLRCSNDSALASIVYVQDTSAAIANITVHCVLGIALWAYVYFPDVPRISVARIVFISFLLVRHYAHTRPLPFFPSTICH